MSEISFFKGRKSLVFLAGREFLAKNSRPAKNTRLFLPLKKGISDISAKTISSWICRTNLLAYESSGEKFLNRHSVN
jgi:hypothetical protein